MSPEPAPIVGVAAIIRRGGRFLLVKRGRPPNLGLWAFPGGRQEWGETIAETALRELMEETGIEAANPLLETVLDVIERDSGDRVRHHFTLVVMALDWLAGEGEAGDDAAAIGWFTPDEAADLPLIASTLTLMRKLDAGRSPTEDLPVAG